MKAIGYKKAGPISAPDSLIDLDMDQPDLGPRDLLVEVRSLAVNPVDVKVRAGMGPKEGGSNVTGYDTAGVVKAEGAEVKLFKVGDAVFYAGDLTRPGTNSTLHAVDERIVGKKPQSMDFAEVAGF